MRYWGILLVLALTACSQPPRYDGPEPTHPAIEPPVEGALYGRVMHETGTGAPRATVGLRQWEQAVEAFAMVFSGGMTCLFGACGQPKYVRQTPEGTYSFPKEMLEGQKSVSVVASYGDNGPSAEVFFKYAAGPQRVPDLVLWEKEPRVRQVGDYVLVSWPRRAASSSYAVYSDRGRISASSRATTKLVPRWQLSGPLSVVASTAENDVKFQHRTKGVPTGVGKAAQHPATVNGRQCLEVHGERRAVLRWDDRIEVSRDGVTFESVQAPSPSYGERSTVVDSDIRYVCGREVTLW